MVPETARIGPAVRPDDFSSICDENASKCAAFRIAEGGAGGVSSGDGPGAGAECAHEASDYESCERDGE